MVQNKKRAFCCLNCNNAQNCCGPCGECSQCCIDECGDTRCPQVAYLAEGKLCTSVSSYVNYQVITEGRSYESSPEFFVNKSTSYGSASVSYELINDQEKILQGRIGFGSSSYNETELPPRVFSLNSSYSVSCSDGICKGFSSVERINHLGPGIEPHFFNDDSIPCNTSFQGEYIQCKGESYTETFDPNAGDFGLVGGPKECGNEYEYTIPLGNQVHGEEKQHVKYTSDLIYGGSVKLYNKFGEEVDPQTVYGHLDSSRCGNKYGIKVGPPQCHYFS